VAGKREQATALGRGASARAAAEQGGVSVHGLCLPCRVLLLPALRLSLSRPLSRFFSRVPRRLRPGLRSPESRRRTGRRNNLNSPQTPRYEPIHVALGLVGWLMASSAACRGTPGVLQWVWPRGLSVRREARRTGGGRRPQPLAEA